VNDRGEPTEARYTRRSGHASQNCIGDWERPMSMSRANTRSWMYALFLFCILTAFVIRGWEAIEGNTNASAYDQRSYLGLGLNLREGKDLSDGKRNPLLPALMSLFARREWAYYTEAKFLNLALGVVCILLAFELGRRWFSPAVGAVVACILSLNPPFLHVCSHIMAEPLLATLTLLTWYLMAQTLSGPIEKRPLYAGLAGLTCGLAYETKATALQMVPAFVLGIIWVYRRRWWRRKEVWLFAGLWLVALIPLAFFNIQEYRNPLYNYNFKHEIYLDSPAQRHFADISEAPTLMTYLQSHTVKEMTGRMWYGLREVTRILFSALAPVRLERLPKIWEMVWIASWVLLAAFLFSQRRVLRPRLKGRTVAFLLLGIMLVLSLIPLGFFVQASNVGPRFIVIFQPMIYIVTLGTIRELVVSWQSRPGASGVPSSIANWGRRLLLAGLLVWSAWSSARAMPRIEGHPFALDREANARGEAVLTWLEEGTPYGSRVLWGPSYTLPNWLFERRLSLKDTPSKVQRWEDVTAFARQKRIAYAIVDWEMLGRREAAFSTYFESDYPYVSIKRLPPDWALVLPYEGIPCNWCVFRLIDAVPLTHQTSFALGDLARLVGHEVYPEAATPGEPVYVTLYWQALEQASVDYTVFVHLLDQQGKLVAQSDSQPVGGYYQTTRWQPGDMLGDRHQVLVPPDQPPGEYRLAVGVYYWQTMERLPVFDQDGTRLGDDCVLLAEPVVVAPPGAPDDLS